MFEAYTENPIGRKECRDSLRIFSFVIVTKTCRRRHFQEDGSQHQRNRYWFGSGGSAGVEEHGM